MGILIISFVLALIYSVSFIIRLSEFVVFKTCDIKDIRMSSVLLIAVWGLFYYHYLKIIHADLW